MATVSRMILRGLRLLGEKSVGATLTSAEQTDYLADMNAMLESWSTERLLCYQIVQDSLALTVGVASYTIGPGGTWNTTRPVRVVDPCWIRDQYNADPPVKVIGADSYGKLILKSTGNTYPTALYYDAADVAGLSTINFYPLPQAGLTAFISSWKQLQQFATINDTVALPPGYQRAIEFNFAIEEAGGWMNVQPEVAKIARESKAAIQSVNLPDTVMRLDAGIVRSYRSNILTGP